ncbi:MAG: glutathione S-transferase family protein, partial [SAR324 cluster bacterium]|nr:glutathione S-transferase family protein [SAR324 cluster bacterium]
ITIADFLAVGLLTLGEVVRCSFSAYPNVERWLGNMKQLSNWGKINEAFYGYVESVKDQTFDAI